MTVRLDAGAVLLGLVMQISRSKAVKMALLANADPANLAVLIVAEGRKVPI